MIHLVDVFHLGRPGVICVGVVGERDLTLVDCGPESAFTNSLRELRNAGIRPEQVRNLALTHIHLDHAGAAWRWATEFGVTVFVHPRGAPHLADPTKLIASARRVFGDRTKMLWGDLQPVPERYLRVVCDGESVGAAGARVTGIETPGHAPHHHAYWQEDSRSIFAGDVAGVSIAGGPLLPPCPPPDIDLAAWRSSLRRLRSLRPSRLLLAHAGSVEGYEALDSLESRIEEWSAWVLARMRAGNSEAEMVPAFEQFVWDGLRAAGVSQDGIEAYEQGDPAAMSVYGLARHWRMFHPELLTA
jgi:glyoxylase-like metal-dependent hydrolase (beta-lactamase superfamily II)